ncbi:hypothetical protein QZH56_00510 [Streptomyces olivoreticuli]|uniref:hypothetical protein n=1 Tax=Streptomyces olivoreticuli TaxID=68246 RepID=UPI002657EA1A|nr:hypothetical protein [Streptomyces olivoreticuli]WKK24211.1 hypothetical protein QZH56_00510 [Streptomyces olivoreticuli]
MNTAMAESDSPGHDDLKVLVLPECNLVHLTLPTARPLAGGGEASLFWPTTILFDCGMPRAAAEWARPERFGAELRTLLADHRQEIHGSTAVPDRISKVFLSQPSMDHCGLLQQLCQVFDIGQLFITGDREAYTDAGLVGSGTAGELSLRLGDPLHFRRLPPHQGYNFTAAEEDLHTHQGTSLFVVAHNYQVQAPQGKSLDTGLTLVVTHGTTQVILLGQVDRRSLGTLRAAYLEQLAAGQDPLATSRVTSRIVIGRRPASSDAPPFPEGTWPWSTEALPGEDRNGAFGPWVFVPIGRQAINVATAQPLGEMVISQLARSAHQMPAADKVVHHTLDHLWGGT